MKKLLIFSVLAVSLYACKDVVNELPDVVVGTTPYEFSYEKNTLLPPPRVPSDNPLTKEGVQLGRMLFYDPILSADSTQSCASCHNQKLAFTDNGKKLSVGIRGLEGKRNAMPIFNLQWHLDGFFWDGRSDILRHLALVPIEDPLEMDETIGNVLAKLSNSPVYKAEFKKAFGSDEVNEELLGKSLEQFMLSIVSAGSKFDKVMLGLESFTPEEAFGMRIFNEEAIPLDQERDPSNPVNIGGDCFHCHGGSLKMIRGFMTNGLPDVNDLGRGEANSNALDNRRFKVPTMRNIELTGPYMHDGRMETLYEVVQHYLGDLSDSDFPLEDEANMHALRDSVYLSERNKGALIAFLKTLTDEELINNPEYASPFE